MLKLMRKHATGWMIKIISGAIIVVFVGFGVWNIITERKTHCPDRSLQNKSP